MFSRKNRIPRETIDKIFHNPEKIFKKGGFLIRISKNNLEIPRFAVVIPKKQVKNAVRRNLIKRQIISLLKKSKITKNIDLVVYLKSFSSEFKTDFNNLLETQIKNNN
jgi:ribonuclease P protein component